MFVYGRTGTNKCNKQGCRCFCETASKDGMCTRTTRDNSDYDLYAYTVKYSIDPVKTVERGGGEVIITMSFFPYLLNILGHDK